ncbi:hypothetical protein DPMN_121412 [Dreissena polymorpha]|uniref:Uncharacterized protein n=1 Tax=Dreissena polymorpha TaxID=45954 RepID=A0A9D4GMD7_DREPO|nr:hypothetical protein DPMN_121412 [Dreissena polymorpha]
MTEILRKSGLLWAALEYLIHEKGRPHFFHPAFLLTASTETLKSSLDHSLAQ